MKLLIYCLPAVANELCRKLLFSEPTSRAYFFEIVAKQTVFGLVTVAMVRQLLGPLRIIGIAHGVGISYIAF